MKKWIALMFSALMLVSAASAEGNYIMTEAEWAAVYQESFDQMNTTRDISVKTLDDLPAFEKEYTQNTGKERKEDLLFLSLPMQGDLPYEEALTIAKQALSSQFGTTEEELAAMGVYPMFLDYIYMPNESEWEFYFTPRTGCDIDLDHDIPAGGEYRVVLGAQTGNIIDCFWYINDFFPEYAQKAWDAGKQSLVYEWFGQKNFYALSTEEQYHFYQLLAGAGYELDGYPVMTTQKMLDENSIGREKLCSMADQAALEASGMDEKAFRDYYAPAFVHHAWDDLCLALVYTKTADQPDGDNHVYQITLNTQTGEVMSVEYTNGVG